MKEIGQKLRERREELGFTLEQMCEKTKVTIPNLKAIEAGDLEYFDNDLSYLRFYIKYYCQALYLDYEPFRTVCCRIRSISTPIPFRLTVSNNNSRSKRMSIKEKISLPDSRSSEGLKRKKSIIRYIH